jgi:hypothetical protein
MIYSKTTSLGLAALASSILTTTTFAASIGVNFAGINADGTGSGGSGSQADDIRTLASSDLAGVVPAGNWNNVFGTTGNLTGLQSDIGATTAAISWISNGLWTARNTLAGSSPNEILTNGYIDDTQGTGITTITFTGLQFVGGYDVYVYYGSDGNDRTGRATLGSTVINFATNTNPFDGTFTAATPEDDGTADNGEYAFFSGVTGSEFTVTVERVSNNVGVHGIQIVGTPVPEPTTVGLLSVGVLGLLARRRCSA